MLIGIVGHPNVGKSTFFKACTLAEVEISSVPFTTIEPNHGIGFVKIECAERFFGTKCNPRFGFCIDGSRFVPIDLLDVAGLVPDSHLGKGLGLEFLNDLNQADALIHIIDISGSTDEKGNQVPPLSYDPLKDVKFLENELDHWYLSILKKGWDKFVRQIKQENLNVKKALAKQLSGLNIKEELIEHLIRKLKLLHNPKDWSKEDLMNLAHELRRITKPMIIAANKIDVSGSKMYLDKLREEFPDYIVVACSAESEVALREAAKHKLINYIPGENKFEIKGGLSEVQEGALDFIKKNVLDVYGNTGIQQVLDTVVFKLLKCIVVYPVENESKLTDSSDKVLPDAFLLKSGATALDLANKVHTDIAEKFIAAIDAKTKKRFGKDHCLENNDVVRIMTR